jgi:hypothetical protein
MTNLAAQQLSFVDATACRMLITRRSRHLRYQSSETFIDVESQSRLKGRYAPRGRDSRRRANVEEASSPALHDQLPLGVVEEIDRPYNLCGSIDFPVAVSA